MATKLQSVLRRAAPWVLMVAGIVWVSAGGRQAGSFPTGGRLPPLAVELSDGTQFALASASAQVTVLNFWASYCAPCREEAPILSALQSGEVRVVGVSIEDLSRPNMLRAASAFGMRYPIAAGDRELLERFRIHAVPTTYVIAKDGVITLSRVGGVTRDELETAIASAKQRG
jgi:cytochrome c biogenesis protein CcmG, thiol:disulfide interchange protein DsbE